MPIEDKKFKKLTRQNAAKAPKTRGVYALYAHDTLVYLGSAAGDDTLRTALQAHLRAPPSNATRYKRESTKNPNSRLKALLSEHQAAHGRAPIGNG